MINAVEQPMILYIPQQSWKDSVLEMHVLYADAGIDKKIKIFGCALSVDHIPLV